HGLADGSRLVAGGRLQHFLAAGHIAQRRRLPAREPRLDARVDTGIILNFVRHGSGPCALGPFGYLPSRYPWISLPATDPRWAARRATCDRSVFRWVPAAWRRLHRQS